VDIQLTLIPLRLKELLTEEVSQSLLKLIVQVRLSKSLNQLQLDHPDGLLHTSVKLPHTEELHHSLNQPQPPQMVESSPMSLELMLMEDQPLIPLFQQLAHHSSHHQALTQPQKVEKLLILINQLLMVIQPTPTLLNQLKTDMRLLLTIPLKTVEFQLSLNKHHTQL
jgi:hypothetical protein